MFQSKSPRNYEFRSEYSVTIDFGLYLLAKRIPSAIKIIEGIPKKTIPILAARGSDSITELTDQAIANKRRKIPRPPNNHEAQPNFFVLFSFIIPSTVNAARMPNMKNNKIIVLSFKYKKD